jgi:hypothetical protein
MEHLETKQNDNGRSLACIEVGETWVEAEFQGQGRRSGIAICGTSSGGRTVPERAMLGDSEATHRVQLGNIGLYCKRLS